MDYVELYQRRSGILTVTCGHTTHTQLIGRNRTLGEPTGLAKKGGEIACQRQEGGTSSLWRLGLADLEAVRVDALAAVFDILTSRVLIDGETVELVVGADKANNWVARLGLADGLLGIGLLGVGLGRLGRRLELIETLLKLGVLPAKLGVLPAKLGVLPAGVSHDVENLLVDVQWVGFERLRSEMRMDRGGELGEYSIHATHSAIRAVEMPERDAGAWSKEGGRDRIPR